MTDNPSTITLDQILKMAGVVATGGQAKLLIQEGQVRVNGVVETRRRKKLTDADLVEVHEESFRVGDLRNSQFSAEPHDID